MLTRRSVSAVWTGLFEPLTAILSSQVCTDQVCIGSGPRRERMSAAPLLQVLPPPGTWSTPLPALSAQFHPSVPPFCPSTTHLPCYLTSSGEREKCFRFLAGRCSLPTRALSSMPGVMRTEYLLQQALTVLWQSAPLQRRNWQWEVLCVKDKIGLTVYFFHCCVAVYHTMSQCTRKLYHGGQDISWISPKPSHQFFCQDNTSIYSSYEWVECLWYCIWESDQNYFLRPSILFLR